MGGIECVRENTCTMTEQWKTSRARKRSYTVNFFVTLLRHKCLDKGWPCTFPDTVYNWRTKRQMKQHKQYPLTMEAALVKEVLFRLCCCHFFFQFFFLNALQSHNNRNTVYAIRHKSIFGPSKCSFWPLPNGLGLNEPESGPKHIYAREHDSIV